MAKTLEDRIAEKKALIARLETKLEKSLQKADETCRRLVSEGKYDELYYYLKSLGYRTYEEGFRVYHHAVELKDARVMLEKYLNMMKIRDDKAAVVKIPVIWEFLTKYKEMMSKWFHENAALYNELKQNQDKAWNEYKGSEEYIRMCSFYGSQYRVELAWRKLYYEPIHGITRDLYRYNGLLDEVKLEDILNKDIENRYFKLVNQVTKIVGVIIDADELKIRNGELNGLIRGEKGKAYVMTVGAGGYNIQCFHYRTLVREAK